MRNPSNNHSFKTARLVYQNGGGEMPDSTEKPDELPTKPEDAEPLPSDPMQQPSKAADAATKMLNDANQKSEQLSNGQPSSDSEINRRTGGAPEVEKNNYPQVVEILKQKMEKMLNGRKPKHAEIVGHTHNDTHTYYLAFDQNTNDYRLFREEEAKGSGKSEHKENSGEDKFKHMYADKLDRSKYKEITSDPNYLEDVKWAQNELASEGVPETKYDVAEKKIEITEGDDQLTIFVYQYYSDSNKVTRAFIDKNT